jgi:hypothetical protein
MEEFKHVSTVLENRRPEEPLLDALNSLIKHTLNLVEHSLATQGLKRPKSVECVISICGDCLPQSDPTFDPMKTLLNQALQGWQTQQSVITQVSCIDELDARVLYTLDADKHLMTPGTAFAVCWVGEVEVYIQSYAVARSSPVSIERLSGSKTAPVQRVSVGGWGVLMQLFLQIMKLDLKLDKPLDAASLKRAEKCFEAVSDVPSLLHRIGLTVKL